MTKREERFKEINNELEKLYNERSTIDPDDSKSRIAIYQKIKSLLDEQNYLIY